jgi:hypothetical protein
VKNVGVIPIPEVLQYEFHPSDKFIIMASDGVWEFISSQEAVDIVQSFLHLGSTFACQQLIQTAATRWQEEEGDYRDDVCAFPSLHLCLLLTFAVDHGNSLHVASANGHRSLKINSSVQVNRSTCSSSTSLFTEPRSHFLFREREHHRKQHLIDSYPIPPFIANFSTLRFFPENHGGQCTAGYFSS